MPYAVFVTGIMKIMWDLIPFILVCTSLLFAFGQMYMLNSIGHGRCPIDYDASAEGSNEFCSLNYSLFKTYGLFVGGIDIEDYADNPLMLGISIVFGYLITIILLNVVIAIVSDSWGKVMDESKEIVRKRLEKNAV